MVPISRETYGYCEQSNGKSSLSSVRIGKHSRAGRHPDVVAHGARRQMHHASLLGSLRIKRKVYVDT